MQHLVPKITPSLEVAGRKEIQEQKQSWAWMPKTTFRKYPFLLTMQIMNTNQMSLDIKDTEMPRANTSLLRKTMSRPWPSVSNHLLDRRASYKPGVKKRTPHQSSDAQRNPRIPSLLLVVGDRVQKEGRDISSFTCQAYSVSAMRLVIRRAGILRPSEYTTHLQIEFHISVFVCGFIYVSYLIRNRKHRCFEGGAEDCLIASIRTSYRIFRLGSTSGPSNNSHCIGLHLGCSKIHSSMALSGID